ncbi:acyl-CoA dehydrogenase family protein [Pseudomonas entomophila]|uniref:acyl-CoA dehydrogenase family protein n=1 Tax=Pseudomonas entomophila TaxID=312306 RepID=UPI0023D7C068|nr:acyl-CoA dehydrogenase family protein [Pseudomonas entomophila]MDF0730113.1 acyl-CoA dehydrogenase family protein [Pseudomonas entomophila]
MSAVHIIRDEREVTGILDRLVPLIAEGAVARDATGELPTHAIETIAASGLLALNVPRQFGGVQASAVSIAQVYRRIAAADPSVAQIFQPHFAALDALGRVGTERQQAFFFAEALQGAWFGNGTTEIGVKRGYEHFQTHLEEVSPGGDYLLTGRKYYSTGAVHARWIAVMAKDPQARIGVAYVQRQAAGVRVEQDWNGFGQRGTSSGTSTFERVEVPRWRVVERWRLFERPQSHGAFGQLHHIGLDLGILDAALQDAVDYVRHRSRPSSESPFASNSEDPVVLQAFGRFSIGQRAAAALLEEAARTYDRLDPLLRDPGTDPAQAADAAAQISLAVAAAKAFAAEQAVTLSSAVFEWMGAGGTARPLGLDRHWRNTRTHSLHDPARWKIHHLGNYLLNGALPPNNGIL